jgi:hypothetical protein
VHIRFGFKHNHIGILHTVSLRTANGKFTGIGAGQGRIQTKRDDFSACASNGRYDDVALREFRAFKGRVGIALVFRERFQTNATLACNGRQGNHFVSAIDIEKFCDQKSVIFITANATDISRFKISNLFFEGLLHNLIEEAEINGGALKRNTRLIIDDFGVGGVIESVPEALSFVRESGISMCLLCQSLSQLNTAYDTAKATTIKNNCDNTIYIGAPNDLETANEMSIRINRPLADMLVLKPDQTLVCRRGHAPLIVNRYKTLEDELYIAVTNIYNKNSASSKCHTRSVRKDFSPMRSTLETIQDLTNEVTSFTSRLDKRYKELTGEELTSTKKISKISTSA